MFVHTKEIQIIKVFDPKSLRKLDQKQFFPPSLSFWIILSVGYILMLTDYLENLKIWIVELFTTYKYFLELESRRRRFWWQDWKQFLLNKFLDKCETETQEFPFRGDSPFLWKYKQFPLNKFLDKCETETQEFPFRGIRPFCENIKKKNSIIVDLGLKIFKQCYRLVSLEKKSQFDVIWKKYDPNPRKVPYRTNQFRFAVFTNFSAIWFLTLNNSFNNIQLNLMCMYRLNHWENRPFLAFLMASKHFAMKVCDPRAETFQW